VNKLARIKSLENRMNLMGEKKEQWMQGAIVGVQDSGHTAGNNMKIGSPL
jgi:hypothetical protein